MLQNHILQVLSLDCYGSTLQDDAREKSDERKTKVLAATRLRGGYLILGQYEGYRNEEGVDPNSQALLPLLLVTLYVITGVGRVFLSTL